MRVRGWRGATAVLGIAAVLALAGCDGSEDPTDPGSTGSGETSESTDPGATVSTEVVTPPEVEAPTPAPEAANDDHAGAIWSARYFLDLYTYMYATGDTTQFAAMSAADCEFCAGTIEEATQLHAGGGWVDGGAIVVDMTQVTAEYPTADEPSYLVRFAADEQPSTVHRGDGTSEDRNGGAFDAVVAVQYVDGRFVVMGVNSE